MGMLSQCADPAFFLTTLRSGGWKVISVLSPIQARFEIEMGRCGVFLVCYRLSIEQAEELTTLFRRNCPEGNIIFLTEPAQRAHIPANTDFTVSESSGPELILSLLRDSGKPRVRKLQPKRQLRFNLHRSGVFSTLTILSSPGRGHSAAARWHLREWAGRRRTRP